MGNSYNDQLDLKNRKFSKRSDTLSELCRKLQLKNKDLSDDLKTAKASLTDLGVTLQFKSDVSSKSESKSEFKSHSESTQQRHREDENEENDSDRDEEDDDEEDGHQVIGDDMQHDADDNDADAETENDIEKGDEKIEN